MTYHWMIHQIVQLASGMLAAVEKLHLRGLVHRDVKPANFCLGKGPKCNVVYLVDFGFVTDLPTKVHRAGSSLPGICNSLIEMGIDACPAAMATGAVPQETIICFKNALDLCLSHDGTKDANTNSLPGLCVLTNSLPGLCVLTSTNSTSCSQLLKLNVIINLERQNARLFYTHRATEWRIPSVAPLTLPAPVPSGASAAVPRTTARASPTASSSSGTV